MSDDRYDAYRNARSTRPAWANALIVAGVILIAAVVMTVMSGFAVAGWFYLSAGVALLVAGVLALTRLRT